MRLEPGGLRFLSLHRPSTEDLIPTKMMRVDPQDRDDIVFLLKQADCEKARLMAALHAAMVPVVPEIQKAFTVNRDWLQGRLAARN